MIGSAPQQPLCPWKYVSIDIETTGLNEKHSDIIEFGAVLDDLQTPLEKLPTFHCYITKAYDQYQGNAKALSMHQKIFERIAERQGGFTYMPDDCLDEDFADWLKSCGVEKAVVAGKNFGSFDLNFLKKIGFGKKTKMYHRFLDPGAMFYDPTRDLAPPDLKECLRRAGVEKQVAHTAVDDALDVIRCIRYKCVLGTCLD